MKSGYTSLPKFFKYYRDGAWYVGMRRIYVDHAIMYGDGETEHLLSALYGGDGVPPNVNSNT